MIQDLVFESDAAGFPVVRWSQPSAGAKDGLAEIECRIVKGPTTGELLFATRGPKPMGAYEEARPWKDLRGFSVKRAQELYPSAAERSMLQTFLQTSGGKGPLSNLLFGGQDQVMLAEFAGDTRMHLNAVDAAVVDIEPLHLILTQAFVTRQRELVSKLCEEAYRWPISDPRVETYKPARKTFPRAKWSPGSIFDTALATTITLAFVALVIWVTAKLFRS